jgi:predicted nuclease of predicted toxin-antitoxin system
MPKFLIDENLSPRLAALLRSLGYDAVAVREVGLLGQHDRVIFRWVRTHHRVVITRDWEFGQVAYWQTAGRVGVIMLRSLSQQLSAHEAILQRLHRERRLQDEQLAEALLIATPADSYWWDAS